jgi:hypothetical protein
VVSQTYSQPAGGFVASSIRPANRVAYVEDGCATSQVTARDATRQTGPELLQNRQNLLHGGSGFCLVQPQSGQDVHLVLDFGREYIGHIELALDAPADTVVDVQGFELIDDGGIAWMHVHNGFRYICRDGDQTFLSHYRRGFRYLSLTLRHFSRPVRIHQICCNQTTYPIEEKGDFSCSDELLNKIYRMSLDTAELCMLDSYVDCPGHEQNFWVGDARITALINLLNIGATDLNQSFIRIVGQSLREDWVKTYWPNDIRYLEGRYLPIAAFPNYPEGCLPMWTFQWLLQIWEHYWYVGDLADLAENFAFVEATIQNCRRLTNERGLFDMPGAWNLIEWGNNDLSPYGEATANNVLLIQCLRRAADMAEALARPELAREYRIEAGHRLAAVNLYCWDETRRAYVDTVRDEWSFCRYLRFAVTKKMPLLTYDQYISCRRISVQSNTLALLTGCVPAERLADVRRIAETVASGHYVSGAPSQRTIGTPGEQEAPGGIVAVGSPFFLFFSLGALYQNGQPDLALKIMRRDWADMIASGSNTCWETFKSDTGHWTRSIAHAWAAAPAFYLPAEILGIQPLEPGYRTFSINPNPGDLSWARGSVITPFGPIEVDWHKDSNGQIILTYAAPAACERKEH